MFFHRLIVAAALCLLLAGVAEAAQRDICWTHPTANTDGSPLPLSQITRTTVVWGASATAMTNSKVVTGTATCTVVDLAPGTWFIAARTTANSNDSALSAVIQHVITQPTPNPPTGLSVVPVVAGLNMSPAYKILPNGERSQVVAGFVPVGVRCAGPTLFRYRDRDYRAVPARRVKWWNLTPADARNPPPVAVACA